MTLSKKLAIGLLSLACLTLVGCSGGNGDTAKESQNDVARADAGAVDNSQSNSSQETPASAPSEPALQGFSEAGLATLDAANAKLVADQRVSGIVTLLARHGEIVAFNAHGVQSVDTGAPMTTDSLFRIYSMTKPVTGVALMMLYEEGKWELDDPITKFVPELDHLKVMIGVDDEGKAILENVHRPPTMRELLTHTAGFGYGLGGANPVDTAFRDQDVLGSPDLQTMIDKLAEIPLLFQPGDRWSYSVAVDIQGYIVQKLSGKTFGEFLEQRIFEPLGMEDTAFYAPVDKADRLAGIYNYDAEQGKLVPSDLQRDPASADGLESGGGGLISSTGDYGRFAQMVLNRGELDGVRLLKPETVDLMLSNHLPDGMNITFGEEQLGTGFGLGWAVVLDPEAANTPRGKGSAYWAGAAGTTFWIDPLNDLLYISMIQCYGNGCRSPEMSEWGLGTYQKVYDALIEPSE